KGMRTREFSFQADPVCVPIALRTRNRCNQARGHFDFANGVVSRIGNIQIDSVAPYALRTKKSCLRANAIDTASNSRSAYKRARRHEVIRTQGVGIDGERYLAASTISVSDSHAN